MYAYIYIYIFIYLGIYVCFLCACRACGAEAVKRELAVQVSKVAQLEASVKLTATKSNWEELGLGFRAQGLGFRV